MNQTALFPTFPRRSFALILCVSLLLGCGREPPKWEEVVDNRPVDFEEIQRQIREAEEVISGIPGQSEPYVLSKMEQETLADLFTADNAVPVMNDRKRMMATFIELKTEGEATLVISLCLDGVVETGEGFLLLKRPPQTDPRLPFYRVFQPLSRDE